MDHNAVVRERMTEKYLLEELDPEMRNEFEEHFFDCPECAMDVRAASDFVTQSKLVLSESAEPSSVHEKAAVQERANRGWFAWLRPAFAIPALALLLAIIGYQNLVTYPQLRSALRQPQVLPATTINLLTYGSNSSPLTVNPGQGFLLNVIIPPDRRYLAYKVDLYSPAGGVESVPIPASANDTWPIRFPEAERQSGTYKLTVHGVTATGQDVEVGTASFQLQIQK